MKIKLWIAVLTFLAVLLPLADEWRLEYVKAHPRPVTQVVMKPVLPPAPPEAGQPGVVFWNGQWWKYANNQWLVWQPNPKYLAQGGANHVVR